MNETLGGRKLKAFTVSAKTEGQTQTRRRLSLASSAVFHDLRALEDDVRCRLLAKMGEKFTQTEAGEA